MTRAEKIALLMEAFQLSVNDIQTNECFWWACHPNEAQVKTDDVQSIISGFDLIHEGKVHELPYDLLCKVYQVAKSMEQLKSVYAGT